MKQHQFWIHRRGNDETNDPPAAIELLIITPERNFLAPTSFKQKKTHQAFLIASILFNPKFLQLFLGLDTVPIGKVSGIYLSVIWVCASFQASTFQSVAWDGVFGNVQFKLLSSIKLLYY